MSTLEGYLDTFADSLADNARKEYPPLQSLTDELDPRLGELRRKPIGLQGHFITAGIKAFHSKQKRLFLCGQMGTGKTYCGVAMAHLSAAKPYRAVVMSPSHIVPKWKREVSETVNDVTVKVIESWKEVLSIPRKFTKTEWLVIGKDRAKLFPYWKPVARVTGPRKDSANTHLSCPHCFALLKNSKGVPLSLESLTKSRVSCPECSSPLWTYISQVRRWSPAELIRKRLSGTIDYFIADEGHQMAGEDTEVAKAFHALLNASKHTLMLTGTLSSGRATDLLPTLHRMTPWLMRREGWKWDNPTAFVEKYGRMETKTVTKDSLNAPQKIKKTIRCVPGIMPHLFGRLMIGSTLFMTLNDVAEGLPNYHEELVPVEMDKEVRDAYEIIEDDLRFALQIMLKHGDKRLLSTMLYTLLSYPDSPWNWNPVGYTDSEMTLEGRQDRFIQVTHPPSLPEDKIYAKEQYLLDICSATRQRLDQAWIYTQFVGERDVPGRLEKVLRAAGFRVAVLRQKVAPDKREEWIEKHGPKVDVVISHPSLVETGVDLFNKAGLYNFNHLVFYQCGYSLHTLRQAAARHIRLGQTKDCFTSFLYHAASMSERAISLMGAKLVFAEGLEGKFSTDGLVSMGADDSLAMALAKSLCEKTKVDARKAWKI